MGAVGFIDGEPVADGGAFGFLQMSDKPCERCGFDGKTMLVYEAHDESARHVLCPECVVSLSRKVRFYGGFDG